MMTSDRITQSIEMLAAGDSGAIIALTIGLGMAGVVAYFIYRGNKKRDNERDD